MRRPPPPIEDWEADISDYGIIDNGKPVYVRVCDACEQLFRTNQPKGHECAECEEQRWIDEEDRDIEDYYDPNWDDDTPEHDDAWEFPMWQYCWSFAEEWKWDLAQDMRWLPMFMSD